MTTAEMNMHAINLPSWFISAVMAAWRDGEVTMLTVAGMPAVALVPAAVGHACKLEGPGWREAPWCTLTGHGAHEEAGIILRPRGEHAHWTGGADRGHMEFMKLNGSEPQATVIHLRPRR